MMKDKNKPKDAKSTGSRLFRDRLIEWSEASLGTSFSSLVPFQRSRQMIKFFIQEVLEKLYPGMVPDDEDEIEDSIVDGSGDGGADFLYRSDEGQVLIIQAKYRNQDAQESPEAVGHLCDLQDRLLKATEGKTVSIRKDVIDIAEQIDWAEDSFKLFFITTGKCGDAANDRAKQGLSNVPAYPDLAEFRSEFYFLDNTGLNLMLKDADRSSDFSDKSIVIQMTPDANGNPWCHFEGAGRNLYVGEVGGGILADVLQEHKASLFTMNIREYVGDSKTNKQIIHTALNDPENFEYFNNGVTAVAGNITPDFSNGTLTCEKMSVINGAQTVKSLLHAATRKSDTHYKPLRKVRVLLRLLSFDYPAEVAFVGDVTRYNNTQNALKIADFRSNDAVQKDLARRFSNLNLKGRDYEYKNKRGEKKRGTIAVTLEEMAKALYAFSFGPDDMYGGTSKLFDASATGLYTKVYINPDSALSESEFSLMAGTFFLCDYVRLLRESLRMNLRSQKKTMHRALEHKGLIYFGVGELERQSYAREKWDLNHDLSKLSRPNSWLAENNTKPRLALERAFEIVSKVLSQQYDLKKAKDEIGFKHRNWFRDEKTLDDIRSGIALALEFGVPPRIWS